MEIGELYTSKRSVFESVKNNKILPDVIQIRNFDSRNIQYIHICTDQVANIDHSSFKKHFSPTTEHDMDRILSKMEDVIYAITTKLRSAVKPLTNSKNIYEKFHEVFSNKENVKDEKSVINSLKALSNEEVYVPRIDINRDINHAIKGIIRLDEFLEIDRFFENMRASQLDEQSSRLSDFAESIIRPLNEESGDFPEDEDE